MKGVDKLNEQLKKLRAALGITLEEFGKKVGITRSAVGRLEKGDRKITEQMVLAICQTNWNGKTVNEKWFRTGEGEMFNQLTEQEKVMKYTALLLKDKDSVIAEAVKNFIVTYEQLDNTSKKLLEDIAIKMLKNIK